MSIQEPLAHGLRVLDFFLMLLGFVYLGIYSFEVLTSPTGQAVVFLNFASDLIFLFFAIDLAIRLYIERKSLRTLHGFISFLKAHWLGIVALAAPMLRSLVILRLLVVLRGIEPFLRSRVSKMGFYIGVALPLVIFSASLAVFDAEQGAPEANISSFPDAIWWSLVTVTTVGFGDRYPVTQEGRVVGSLLIFVGIALFSTLTALIASWVMSEKK